MHPQSQNLGNDGESLQTDVMRFMAIIGFCLIAILALVRNVEPMEATAEPARAPVPEALPEVLPEPLPEPAPQRPESLLITEAVPAPEPDIEQALPTEPEPPSAASPENQPAAESAAGDEGLILRFASDGDFLRLIAKGDIQVYAFQETDVLTLNSSYRFLDTQSPGQVYELLRPSIPGLIVDALKQARHDIDGFRWGIALPERISNQIERHLGQVSGGQLVIDRYGEVHHVAAS